MQLLSSIWKLKCPRCRRGDLFQKPFELSKPLEMPKQCSECGLRTTPEPGYYFGAMFISYIISGMALLAFTLTAVFYFGWTVAQAMTGVVFISIISYIRLLRLSRSLWIHMMISYDPEKVNRQIKEAPANQKLT